MALASSAFRIGNRLLVVEEASGVGDASLVICLEVEGPQARQGITASPGAQEGHATPIGIEAEGARRPEPEASRACPLARVGLAGGVRMSHGPIVPVGRRERVPRSHYASRP